MVPMKNLFIHSKTIINTVIVLYKLICYGLMLNLKLFFFQLAYLLVSIPGIVNTSKHVFFL